ncbi:hypothetical protein Vadar_011689 [Vaccinium darrowii]|uniref:Uncharacterized protein n=1 Tax=Vaccinium darrowii TaxID=229202 RepID=A0ACB7WZW7_9ERIC|nr:hypothetical protein Vadar_011689 [Vaccinium darrowii]
MVLESARKRIPQLCDKLLSSLCIHNLGFAIQDLPEEILTDILSRLPVGCVLKCRRVCKQWLALTSTPQFVEMHVKQATPVLLLQFVDSDYSNKMLDVFIFDERAKANKMFKKMGADLMNLNVPHWLQLCGSCNGLLVFCQRFPRVYFVCNPLTGGKISITPPVQSGEVCGFFFHPIVKDYRLLFVHWEGIQFIYSIYSLGNQLWRKLDNFPYQPVSLARPTILNGALHWMADRAPCSNSIMIFNMDTERLRNMPDPGGHYCSWQLHNDLSIFEMNGKLAFCCLAKNKSLVYMSVLDDYENWIWENSCLIDLDLVVKCSFKDDCLNSNITLLDIQDNELLFDWEFRGVFRYNLRQNTVKQISSIGMKEVLHPKLRGPNIHVIPYTKTFVLPSGFK